MDVQSIIIFILITIGSAYSDRITVHTSDQNFTQYSYFPLYTNHLQFSVKAANDIHIILSNTHSSLSAFYEIVIGGWSNTKSVIRKDNQDARVKYNEAIINPKVFQTFWVHINDTEGSISVGKEGGSKFLFFKDPDYNKMSYFGISTGYGSKGEWNFDFGLFDCIRSPKLTC